jgi:hypothetical protein
MTHSSFLALEPHKTPARVFVTMHANLHSHNKTLFNALTPSAVTLATNQATAFLASIHELKKSSGNEAWIFGNDIGPTALDAHTVPFIARLIDAGKEGLVPENLLQYTRKAMEGREWQEITSGRPTLFSLWLADQK